MKDMEGVIAGAGGVQPCVADFADECRRGVVDWEGAGAAGARRGDDGRFHRGAGLGRRGLAAVLGESATAAAATVVVEGKGGGAGSSGGGRERSNDGGGRSQKDEITKLHVDNFTAVGGFSLL